MRPPKIALVLLLLINIPFAVLAEDAEYNAESKILTIPTVKVAGGYIYNVQIKLDDLDGLIYSKSPATGSIYSECPKEKITLDKFKQIANGMTLDQVTNIIGCKAKLNLVSSGRSLYKWVGVKSPVVPKISIQVENNIVVHKSYAPPK